MKNQNHIFNYDIDDDQVASWDSLRFVPFAGEEKEKRASLKTEIGNKLSEAYKPYKKDSMTAREFLFILFDAIQPILSGKYANEIPDDYNFWKEELSEIAPYIAIFWAECDPALISYLFMVFVAQFIILLKLWGKVDYSKLCIRDCAMMGEFFLGVGMIQNDMLLNALEKWHLQDEGRPNFLPL